MLVLLEVNFMIESGKIYTHFAWKVLHILHVCIKDNFKFPTVYSLERFFRGIFLSCHFLTRQTLWDWRKMETVKRFSLYFFSIFLPFTASETTWRNKSSVPTPSRIFFVLGRELKKRRTIQNDFITGEKSHYIISQRFLSQSHITPSHIPGIEISTIYRIHILLVDDQMKYP